MPGNSSGVAAVERAVSILEAFTDVDSGLTLRRARAPHRTGQVHGAAHRPLIGKIFDPGAQR